MVKNKLKDNLKEISNNSYLIIYDTNNRLNDSHVVSAKNIADALCKFNKIDIDGYENIRIVNMKHIIKANLELVAERDEY